MSSRTTELGSTENDQAWRRIFLALAASVLAGIPTRILGIRFAFISGGDEGRWQPFTAAAGLAWAVLVFAFVFPAARERWGRANEAAASGLTGIGATLIVFIATIMWLFVFFIVTGYEES